MRPLLIGQAPSRTATGRAFDGPNGSGARLSRLLGRPLLDAVDAINLLDRWPGKKGKGDAFPAGTARRAALRLAPSLRNDVRRGRGRAVIFVGRGVAAAFGESTRCNATGRLYCLGWHWSEHGFRYAILPHPSAVNRWWNDPKNVARARRFLRAAVAGKDLR